MSESIDNYYSDNYEYEDVENYLGEHFVENDKSYLYYKRNDVVTTQRNFGKIVLKTYGKKIFTIGRQVMYQSVPCMINSEETFLQRVCQLFRMLPEFYDRFKTQKEPIDKLASLCGFAVRQFCNSLDQRKPFNPIWGETTQFECKDFTFDLEQSIHHPPVISFYVENKAQTFKYYGTKDLEGSIRPNSLIGSNYGTEHLEIDGQTYSILSYPKYCYGNILLGKRYTYLDDKFILFDYTHGWLAVIFFDIDQVFQGYLWNGSGEPNKMKGYVIEYDHTTQTPIALNDLIKIKQKKFEEKFKHCVMAVFEGHWVRTMTYRSATTDGNVELWNMGTSYTKLPLLKERHHLLPSDSKYRKDLQAFKNGSLEDADNEKNILEDIQRNDKKIRTDYTTYNGKSYFKGVKIDQGEKLVFDEVMNLRKNSKEFQKKQTESSESKPEDVVIDETDDKGEQKYPEDTVFDETEGKEEPKKPEDTVLDETEDKREQNQ